MKRIFSLVALLIPVTLSAQTALEISEKAIDIITNESMEMVSTLKIYDAKGSERVRQITTASKKFGNTNKMMIKFIAPADVKGTAVLIYDYETMDDDMWLYLPVLRKTRRLVNTDKGKSFMGSEFTNTEMSKPNLNDFQYKILGTETCEGKECWKIESVCNNKILEEELGISKKISFIEKGTYLCHKVEFYNLEGKLHKTQYISQYKKQPDGKYFAYQMEMKNELNGRRSVLTIDKFQTGSNLSENAFTAAMLEKM